MTASQEVFDEARVVVIGGGAGGAGVLWGLARRGWTDVLLVERKRLTAGSTWKAAGLLPTYSRSRTEMLLARRSHQIYATVGEAAGLATGFHPSGELRIARSGAQLDEYRRFADAADSIGSTARLVDEDEIRRLWPMLGNEPVAGGLYSPEDGWTTPADTTMAMARAARLTGARIREGLEITGARQLHDGPWELATSQGAIRCEHVVIATGSYARQTAQIFGFDIPTVSLAVQYWITEPIPEIIARKAAGRPEMPIVRDEGFVGYTREEGDGLLIGTYEAPENLDMVTDPSPTYDDELLPANLEAHERGLGLALGLIPTLARTGLRSNTRGYMQYSADGGCLVGPAAGLENVWISAALPGGVKYGGGVGDALAEWIIAGEPGLDMTDMDPRRFGAEATPAWVGLKAVELWGAHCAIQYPGPSGPAGRSIFKSSAHAQLDAFGAVWDQIAGWEVARWFAPFGTPRAEDETFSRPSHEQHVRAEMRAARDGAAFSDLTACGIFDIRGTDTEAFLSRFDGQIPAVGATTRMILRSAKGGALAAFEVARITADHARLYGPARTAVRDGDFLSKIASSDARIDNLSGLRGVLLLSGALSKKRLANDDMQFDTRIVGQPDKTMMMPVGVTGGPAWLVDMRLDDLSKRVEILLAAEVTPIGHLALTGLRALAGLPEITRELTIETRPQIKPARFRLNPSAQLLGNDALYLDETPIGRITSWGPDPDGPGLIALAVVDVALPLDEDLARENFAISNLGRYIPVERF